MSDDKNETVQQEDLTKDLEFPGNEYVNMEGENRSTAAEGELISPEEDKASEKNLGGEAKDETPSTNDEKNISIEEDKQEKAE